MNEKIIKKKIIKIILFLFTSYTYLSSIIINNNNDEKRLLYTLTLLKELGFEEASIVDPAGTQHYILTSKVRYLTVNSKSSKAKANQRRRKSMV